MLTRGCQYHSILALLALAACARVGAPPEDLESSDGAVGDETSLGEIEADIGQGTTDGDAGRHTFCDDHREAVELKLGAERGADERGSCTVHYDDVVVTI